MIQETIWKFELQTTDVQSIQMPKGAEILCVQTQNETPCIWAKVDPTQELERRHFAIIGTGKSVSSGFTLRYIGTYQLHNGSFVGHCFEF